MNETAILTFGVLAACFLTAAWPLCNLPRMRRVLAGTAGSMCIATASGMIGLALCGIFPVSSLGSEPLAGENSPAEASDPVISAPAEDTVKIPPGRPEWVDADPDYTSKVHTVPVASGPYVHEGESRRALDQAIVKATREYVRDQLGSDLAPQLIQYDAKSIKRKLVQADNLYHDVATYSVGPMHEYFALLEFGPEFRNELDRRWNHVRATSRLSQVGLFGGAGLLFLASIFGYFRLDNATRGYYTGRLQFMTAAAILTVVGVGAMLSQWIHWL